MKIETGLPQVIDLVEKILAPVGSTALDVYQGLVGDRVTRWRMLTAAKAQSDFQDEVRRLGVKVNTAKIPERFAVAWFEEASKADEDDIRILFARLLARAASDETDVGPDRRLVDILSRMTVDDAAVFNRIFSDKPFPDTGIYAERGSIADARHQIDWPEDWAMDLLEKFHPGAAGPAVEHLVVLGVLRRSELTQIDRGRSVSVSEEGSFDMRELARAFRPRAFLTATELGKSLRAAVRE